MTTVPPMTSVQKVHAGVEQIMAALPALQSQVAGMEAMALAMAAPYAPQIAAGVLERLPADPAQLDTLLEQAAGWVLSLRSDDVAALEAGS